MNGTRLPDPFGLAPAGASPLASMAGLGPFKPVLEAMRRVSDTASEAWRLELGPGPKLATPHRMVRDLPTLQLLDYTADERDGLPILVHAPFAGHTSAIADFHAHQSLMRCLQAHAGGRLYLTDWKTAHAQTRDYRIEDYLAELLGVIDHLGGRVHLAGLCQGGWACAMLAALAPEKVASLVLAGAPLDLAAGSGPIRRAVGMTPFAAYEAMVAMGGGVMPGAFMLEGFKAMHPFDQYVKRYLDLYEHVEDPRYREKVESFSAWFENPLDMPGRWYLQVVRELFYENRFWQGRFEALGRTIGIAGVSCPTYLLAGEHDEITPPVQVTNAKGRLATPRDAIVQKVVPGGHVGLFMSHRSIHEVWPAIAEWQRDPAVDA